MEGVSGQETFQQAPARFDPGVAAEEKGWKPAEFRGRGSGSGLVLGTVLLLVLILSLLQLHQSFYAETVFDEAVAVQLGAVATTLAESAVEELQLAVKSSVNDPAQRAFAHFREPFAIDPLPGFEIDADSIRRVRTGGRTREILSRMPLSRQYDFSLTMDPPRVLFRRLFENGLHNFNEHFGSVAYRASVTVTRNRLRVERRVEATQDFKVLLAGIVPPFDQASLFLMDANPLLAGDTVNSAAETFSEIKSRYSKAVKKLMEAREMPTGLSREDLVGLGRTLDRIPTTSADDAGSHGKLVRRFRFPMVVASRRTFTKHSDISGPMIDLAESLSSWRNRVIEQDMSIRDKAKAVERGSGTLSSRDLAEIRELAESTLEYQNSIYRWQEMFIQFTNPRDIAAYTGDLAHTDTASMKKRAFFAISDRTIDINAALSMLLSEIENRTGTRTLNGLVWVENDRSDFVLKPPYDARGRVVFAVTGPVIIRDLRPPTAGDRIGVIAYGRATVRGSFHGTLVTLGSDYEFDDARITGSLVLARPEKGKIRGVSIHHDPRLTGFEVGPRGNRYRPSYYYVGVSPRFSSKTIARKATD